MDDTSLKSMEQALKYVIYFILGVTFAALSFQVIFSKISSDIDLLCMTFYWPITAGIWQVSCNAYFYNGRI